MSDFIQHIVNGLSLGSIYALIALGYTMVYGILQLINFAHSEVYMMGAFFAYYAAKFMRWENTSGDMLSITGAWAHFFVFFVILFAAMVGCGILGFLIEKLAYRPLRKAPKLNILITAIGVSLFLQYMGQLIFGADPKVFPTPLENTTLVEIYSVPLKSLDILVFCITLFFMFILHYLIFHTRQGKAMRAVSSNFAAASLVGINPDRIISFTFVVGSALAGVGSVLVGLKYPKIEPLMGTMIGLKAFVAAVLGGIGNLPGAVLGALLMGFSEEMVVAYFSSTYRDALAFGILIVILIFRPAGLLGKMKVEKV